MRLSKFKSDLEKEVQGVTIDLGDGGSITVARFGNKKFQECLQELREPYRQQIKEKALSDEKGQEIMALALARTILLGWTGIEDDAGNQIPYSEETAFQILKNPEFKDFTEKVIKYSSEFENFQAEALEEAKKKSG